MYGQVTIPSRNVSDFLHARNAFVKLCITLSLLFLVDRFKEEFCSRNLQWMPKWNSFILWRWGHRHQAVEKLCHFRFQHENIRHIYLRKHFNNATQLLFESHAGDLWEVSTAGNTPLRATVQQCHTGNKPVEFIFNKRSLFTALNLVPKPGDTVLYLCNNEETVLKISNFVGFVKLGL